MRRVVGAARERLAARASAAGQAKPGVTSGAGQPSAAGAGESPTFVGPVGEGVVLGGGVPPSRDAAIGATWFGAPGVLLASKFGTDAEQRRDLQTLGVRLCYQVGFRELTWAELSSRTTIPGEGVGIPIPDAESTIRSRVVSTDNVAATATYLRQMAAGGMRVLFICVSDGNPRVSDGADWPAYGVAEPIKLDWEVDGRDTLDLEDTYHVEHLGYIASAIGELLVAVADDLAPSRTGSVGATDDEIDIHDVVLGLMLFDKVDGRNVVPGPGGGVNPYEEGDAVATAALWADAIAVVGTALREALADGGLEVPFYLPGIRSYYETTFRADTSRTTRNSWAFISEFCAELWPLLATYFDAVRPGGLGWREQFAGVAYEWDHRSKGEPSDDANRIGPRHIAHLARDVAEIRDMLDDAGLPGADVLVVETGTSTTDADEFVPTWVRAVMTEGGRQARFQAWEVWRRLGGALGARADAVGWRKWMYYGDQASAVTQHKEYYSTGLRFDDRSPTSSAKWSVPRQSWAAYQRFVALAGNMTSPDLVWPSVPADVDWTPSDADGLVIPRLTTRSSGGAVEYVYLLLVDPTASAGTAWRVRAEAAGARGAGADIEVWDTEPTSHTVVSGGKPGGLPDWIFQWPEPRLEPLPWTEDIAAGDAPLLVTCAQRLRWARPEPT